MHDVQGRIYIYTDGSCLKNPGGPGGWCAIMRYHDGTQLHEKVLSGRDAGANVTNNRMELTAVIRGLEAVRNSSLETIVMSDSSYFVDGFNNWMHRWERNNWEKAHGDCSGTKDRGVLNKDLWKQLYELSVRLPKARAEHVRGHNGNATNERADERAKLEALGVV